MPSVHALCKMWALPGDLSLVTAGSNLAYTLSLDVLFCLPWCNPDRDLPDLFFSLQNIPLLHKTLLQSVFKLWEDGGSSYYCNVNMECLVFAFLGARFGSVFLYISFPSTSRLCCSQRMFACIPVLCGPSPKVSSALFCTAMNTPFLFKGLSVVGPTLSPSQG